VDALPAAVSCYRLHIPTCAAACPGWAQTLDMQGPGRSARHWSETVQEHPASAPGPAAHGTVPLCRHQAHSAPVVRCKTQSWQPLAKNLKQCAAHQVISRVCSSECQGDGTAVGKPIIVQGRSGQHAAVGLACSTVSNSCLLSTEANSTSPPGQRHMKWGILHLAELYRASAPTCGRRCLQHKHCLVLLHWTIVGRYRDAENCCCKLKTAFAVFHAFSAKFCSTFVVIAMLLLFTCPAHTHTLVSGCPSSYAVQTCYCTVHWPQQALKTKEYCVTIQRRLCALLCSLFVTRCS